MWNNIVYLYAILFSKKKKKMMLYSITYMQYVITIDKKIYNKH